MSHLLRHLGIPTMPPYPAPDPEPRCVRVTARLLARFAAYHRAHEGWNGLRFDGMESEAMDSEAAELAGILAKADQRTRWKIANRSVRYVG